LPPIRDAVNSESRGVGRHESLAFPQELSNT